MCLVASMANFGGIPGGTCSRQCNSDAECPAASSCFVPNPVTGGGFCVERCTIGPAGGADFDPNKCHGRQDFACTPAAQTGAACLPRCNVNADCQGQPCNLASGFCTSPLGNAPTGTMCTPGLPQQPCTGACVPIQVGTSSTGMCSDNCTVGAAAACKSLSTFDAYCGLLPPGAGVGDAAHCIQLCNCTTDCRNNLLKCVKLQQPIAMKQGYCGDLGPGKSETLCP
jgi:hypothetical protein